MLSGVKYNLYEDRLTRSGLPSLEEWVAEKALSYAHCLLGPMLALELSISLYHSLYYKHKENRQHTSKLRKNKTTQHAFKQSLSLKRMELDATNHQVQKLCIISKEYQ